MAAPERFAEKSDSSCTAGTVHTWPKDYGAPPPRSIGPLAEQIAELVRNGTAPSDVAALVLKAVRDNELYIFTHPDMRPLLEARVDRFLTAYRKVGQALQEIKQ